MANRDSNLNILHPQWIFNITQIYNQPNSSLNNRYIFTIIIINRISKTCSNWLYEIQLQLFPMFVEWTAWCICYQIYLMWMESMVFPLPCCKNIKANSINQHISPSAMFKSLSPSSFISNNSINVIKILFLFQKHNLLA